LLSTATYTGLTIGPPLGGWVISVASWRWVFYVNLPAAALVIGLGWWFLPASPTRRRSFDWGGTATFVTGLPLLLLAIAQGESWGWTSWPVVSSAVAGLSLLALFVRIESTVRSPLLDLSLFRSRVFTGSVLSAVGNYIALFILVILLPYYLLEARRMPTAEAGLLVSAQPLVMAMVAWPAGRLSDRIGSRGLASGGLLVLAVGLVGMSSIGADTPLTTIVLWLAVMGLGTGTFISPNSSALMGAAPRARQGVASGVMAVARNFGMIIGVAAATSVFTAAGGQTGHSWQTGDYRAFGIAMFVAAIVCGCGSLAAALRGKQPPA